VEPASQQTVALQSALGRIRSRWGSQAVATAAATVEGSLTSSATEDACPSGIPELDRLLGLSGWPRGRLSLCLGALGVGRMLTGYHFLAAASQDSAAVLFADLSGHADPGLMARLGARLERVLVLRPVPGSGEWVRRRTARDRGSRLREQLQAVLSLIRAGAGGALIDLPAGAEEEMCWDPMASSLAQACARAEVPLLILAERPGAALRHAAGVIVGLRRRGWVARHGDIEGVQVEARMEKNKLPGGGYPGASTELAFSWRSIPLATGEAIMPMHAKHAEADIDDSHILQRTG